MIKCWGNFALRLCSTVQKKGHFTWCTPPMSFLPVSSFLTSKWICFKIQEKRHKKCFPSARKWWNFVPAFPLTLFVKRSWLPFTNLQFSTSALENYWKCKDFPKKHSRTDCLKSAPTLKLRSRLNGSGSKCCEISTSLI